MMEWTDRHCRSFHRLLSSHARLYTEMVTTGALLHGDVGRHLDFDARERPLALQLGGSDPADLAHCAKLGQSWGYDEINLNCGCPSERVQRGSFGACLMGEPRLVAECVRAMIDAVDIPVTVKHRIGIDRNEEYGFVRDFVGQCFDAGSRVFIVHARNAWLDGLSPKENRDVPPLRYRVVRELKRDFPEAKIVLNGGLTSAASVHAALDAGSESGEVPVDGVMLGRAAYQQPRLLAELERELFQASNAGEIEEEELVARLLDDMTSYLERAVALGATPWSVIRHTLGLMHGLPGARTWRRMLSDPSFVRAHGTQALRRAAQIASEGRPPGKGMSAGQAAGTALTSYS